MDHPLYSNVFSVAYNQQTKELFLSFAIEYPQVTVSTVDRTDPQIETKRVEICSLVLPKAAAGQLIESLKQSLAGEEKNE